ncbi:MAG: flagellar brake protein [Psychrosphaera sp.]|nr:flagellar brake protein [Psychrosphaera sp.]
MTFTKTAFTVSTKSFEFSGSLIYCPHLKPTLNSQQPTAMIIEQDINVTLSKIAAGSQVVVDIRTPAGQQTKFKTTYIGFLPSRFILLQMPDLSKHSKLPGFVKDKISCTVRGLIEGHEGAVVAFISNITSATQTPSKMLVLSIPSQLQLQHLRKLARIDTYINIVIKVNEHHFSGVILNLSARGALLTFDKVAELILKEGENLDVSVVDKKFGKIEDFKGKVCNVKKQVRSLEVGLSFVERSGEIISQLIKQILFV